MKQEVHAALLRQFPKGQYALLDEVRDEAGHAANRSADAIAMGLWPSRGIHLHGIEIKSQRGDWLNELKNPAKAENIFQYCDKFWLLATNQAVVMNVSEIPASWGYLLMDGRKTVVVKEAPLQNPKELSRTFFAAIIKRAVDRMIHPAEIQSKIDAALTIKILEERNKVQGQLIELKNIKEYIQSFDAATGLTFYDRYWDTDHAKELGNAVRTVMASNESLEWHTACLKRLQQEIKGMDKKITDILSHTPVEQQQEMIQRQNKKDIKELTNKLTRKNATRIKR